MGRKSKAPVEDDFIMTIDSDDEAPVEQIPSDEEPEDVAILSKKQRKLAEKRQQEQQAKDLMSTDFEFDTEDSVALLTAKAGCSWDFSKAIEKIKAMQAANAEQQGIAFTPRVPIEDRIAKKRKERKALKKKQLEEERAAKKDEEEDEAESEDEGKEEDNKDEKEDSEEVEEEEEEEDDDEEDVVEEERLQAAVKEHSKIDKTEDEIEKEKADEFFESDNMGANASDIQTFAQLNLSRPLMRAIEKLGFVHPTPIQKRAIPIALTGKDICASAQTGSGKTAAFLLPILERLQYRTRRTAATRVMIICPVRELATQCQSVLEQLAQFTDITCSLVVGGLPIKMQEVELRNRPDVVVCTPGRMIDHIRNSKSVHMDELEILVLDEADRLLEMGFAEEVQELVNSCPKERQTLLFSATMTSKVDQLIGLSMKRPVRISTDPLYDVANNLIQEFVRIRPNRENDREAILLALCTRTFKTNTIVFLEYKKHCHRMMILFGLAGIKAAELHGNMSQQERLLALQRFRDGSVDVLLCTDVAARGIDIHGVHAVINYEMPKDITTYVHRVGRTARAGRKGRAVTLTSESRRLVTKQVIRQCEGVVKSRAVPPQVIEQWFARIESMEGDVKSILEEENLDRQMKSAEMEATRARNLVVHKDEIFNRPARTWFQSEKEKKEIKDATTEEAKKLKNLKPKPTLNRKKRRLKDVRCDEYRETMAQQEVAEENDTAAKSVFTHKNVAASASHSKKARIAAEKEKRNMSIAEIQQYKDEKKAKRMMAAANRKKSGFDADLADQPKTKKSPVANHPVAKEFVFKEKITNLRRQGKRAVNSFKSKKRYSRR